jgi:precorrin-2 dehydrogenase / sirohydrochlorin ferrochelatase
MEKVNVMKYYPVYLDVNSRKCLVVGGGSVGTRKILMLLRCGAKVTVISPMLTEELHLLAEKKIITWKSRPYEPDDMDDAFLVIGATDNDSLNQQIHADAKRLDKLCNIADRPESCNFILPSVVDKGDLIIAVSTSGKSPAYSKELKKCMEAYFGEEHAVFLKLMGAIRKKLLSRRMPASSHKPIFEKLVCAGLVDMIKRDDEIHINRILMEILGKGYDFKTLIRSG